MGIYCKNYKLITSLLGCITALFCFASPAQSLSKLWDKRYGGSDDDYCSVVIPIADDGYLIGGMSYSGSGGDKSETSRGNRDYWIIKVDANDNKVWDKRYGTSTIDDLHSVKETSDGGFILAGICGTSGISPDGDKTDTSRGNADFWVIKINSVGVKQWDKCYGGSKTEILTDILPTVDNGFLLGGECESGADGDCSEPNRGTNGDYWVIKIDSSGNKQWDKRYGGFAEDVLMDILIDNSGNYLLGGYSFSYANGDKTETSQGESDYWVVKCTPPY